MSWYHGLHTKCIEEKLFSNRYPVTFWQVRGGEGEREGGGDLSSEYALRKADIRPEFGYSTLGHASKRQAIICKSNASSTLSRSMICLTRYLTGLMPPPTPQTASSLTRPCFMLSRVSARHSALAASGSVTWPWQKKREMKRLAGCQTETSSLR